MFYLVSYSHQYGVEHQLFESLYTAHRKGVKYWMERYGNVELHDDEWEEIHSLIEADKYDEAIHKWTEYKDNEFFTVEELSLIRD